MHFICPICLNRDKVVSYISGESDKSCQINGTHHFKFKNDTPPRRTKRDAF